MDPNGRKIHADDERQRGSRIQRSLAGWSVIEKVTDFTHAVCRVSDGRGSAVLIGLPRHRQQHIVFLDGDRGNSKGIVQMEPTGRCREHAGVLLTTSFVFPTREDAQGATVTFLEQPVVGTSARIGRTISPVEVPVQPGEVFFRTPVAEPPTVRPKTPLPPVRGVRCNPEDEDGSACGPYTFAEVGFNNLSDFEQELGCSFTICDMSSLNHGASTSPQGSSNRAVHNAGENYPAKYLDGNFSTSSSCQQPRSCAPSGSLSMLPVSATLGAARMVRSWRCLTDGEELNPVRPLPLPLLLSRLPPVKVGDTHLIISHINGWERRYVVLTVNAVGKESCRYDFDDIHSEYSSGGPIFDMQGNFIGIQHQRGFSAYGIFASFIVRDLFQSMVLGICRLPIAETRHSVDECSVYAEKNGGASQGSFYMGGGSLRLSTQMGNRTDSPESFRLPQFDDAMQVKKVSPLHDPPLCDDVWKEFYTDFQSIALILYSFSHSPQVTKTALEELASKEYTKDLPEAASIGVIGILLEIVDEYADNVEVLSAAVIALARASLYKLNREAIFRCEGILTLLHIMDEYSYHVSIQHWGFCCLCNVMDADSLVRSDAIRLFVQYDGIDLAIEVLSAHRNESHVLRQTSFALSCVVREHVRYMDIMVSYGIGSILVGCMKSNAEDHFALLGLTKLLYELLYGALKSSGVSNLPDVSQAKDDFFDSIWVVSNEVDDINTMSSSGIVLNNHAILLLSELDNGNICQVLSNLMEGLSREVPSSAVVRLLTECAGCVIALLLLYHGYAAYFSLKMRETCELIINKNPGEIFLVRRLKTIVRRIDEQKNGE
uniref:WGS project CAEQ00000000 data, annotated contig 508 n=1 Tax=Trypanosoma congolense (strain IL3000) TaxID=1068625 RepID=F9WGJ9_TRYCI|nr:unnamed protein product [Trypanosoma congolense IL3000]